VPCDLPCAVAAGVEIAGIGIVAVSISGIARRSVLDR
jgi:hypothetical protein